MSRRLLPQDPFSPTEYRPRRPDFVRFVRHHWGVIGVALTVVLLLTTPPATFLWTASWLGGFALVRGLVLPYLWERRELRDLYASSEGVKAIAAFIFIVVLVYSIGLQRISDDQEFVASDTLWLLYCFPAIYVARQGRTRNVVVAAGVAAGALWSTAPESAVWVEVAAKGIWILLVGFVAHSLYFIIGRRNATLRAIHGVGIEGVSDEPELVKHMLAAFLEELDFDYVALCRQVRGDLLLEAAVAKRPSTGVEDVTPQLGIVCDGIPSLVATAAKVAMVNDIRKSKDYRPVPMFPDARAELAVPVRFNDEALGVLDIRLARRDSFLDQDREAANLMAGHVGRQLALVQQLSGACEEVLADVHDQVKNKLALVELELKAALTHRMDSELHKDLEKAHLSVERAVAQLRDLARPVDPRGTTHLDAELSALAEQSPRGVTFKLAQARVRCHREHVTHARAIVTEAIANAKKAASTAVDVSLALDGKWCLVTVVDNGPGLELSSLRPGSGLANMRERARKIGSNLNVEVPPDGGTRVSFKVPLLVLLC